MGWKPGTNLKIFWAKIRLNLVDAKIRASDKDLPVSNKLEQLEL